MSSSKTSLYVDGPQKLLTITDIYCTSPQEAGQLSAPMFIVGNKLDLEHLRCVTQDMVKELADVSKKASLLSAFRILTDFKQSAPLFLSLVQR